MSVPNSLLSRFPQKPPTLTEDELHQLWTAALSDDEASSVQVVRRLAKQHPFLRDGVYLF